MKHKLTEIERIAFSGLMARDREVQRDHVQPLQLDIQTFFAAVEQRLKLSRGALGTTHQIDPNTMNVVEIVGEPSIEES